MRQRAPRGDPDSQGTIWWLCWDSTDLQYYFFPAFNFFNWQRTWTPFPTLRLPAVEETILVHWAVTNTRERDEHKSTLCSAYKKAKRRLKVVLWYITCLAANAIPSNSSSNNNQFRKLGVEAKTYNPSIWEAWAPRLQIKTTLGLFCYSDFRNQNNKKDKNQSNKHGISMEKKAESPGTRAMLWGARTYQTTKFVGNFVTCAENHFISDPSFF